MPPLHALDCTLKELTSDAVLQAFGDADWRALKLVLEDFIAVAWGFDDKKAHKMLSAATKEVAAMPGDRPAVKLGVFFSGLKRGHSGSYDLIEVSDCTVKQEDFC